MSKNKGKKKTYGISLNDASEVDAALMRELDARGNTAATLRAALKLLFWGEATELPSPPEHPLAELIKAMILEQQQTRQETIDAIHSIQMVMPLAIPSTNGNGHHKPPDDEYESMDNPAIRNLLGLSFKDADWSK